MIGYKLKELRLKKSLTIAQVSEMLGINTNTYAKYERCERDVSTDTLSKFADFYGVTTDYLLGREPAPNPFAELNLRAEDETAVMEKFMSLPESFRACALELLRELAGAIKGSDSVQSTAQSQITKNEDSKPEIGVTYSKIHTDEGSVIIRETPPGLPKISEFFDD